MHKTLTAYVEDEKGNRHNLFQYNIEIEDTEEEPSVIIETAPLFWELIKDELESSEEWKHFKGWTIKQLRIAMVQGGKQPPPDNHYKRDAHKLDMSEEGQIKYMGAMSPYIDTTIDLAEGDNLEQLLTWIQDGGPCPLYKK